MITDNGLRLATAENVAAVMSSDRDVLGAASVALKLDHTGITEALRQAAGGTLAMDLACSINTAFACDSNGATLEIQLVSLAIDPALLDGGAGTGSVLQIAGVSTSGNNVILANHGLPTGTPVRVVSAGTSTLNATDVYYIHPVSSSEFTMHDNPDDARTGANPNAAGTSSNVTLGFVPTVHASSGSLAMYDEVGGSAGNAGPLALAGERLHFSVKPLSGDERAIEPQQYVGQARQKEGAGKRSGTSAQIATNAQRFFLIRYLLRTDNATAASNISAGALTIDLVLCGDNPQQGYTASGYEVVG